MILNSTLTLLTELSCNLIVWLYPVTACLETNEVFTLLLNVNDFRLFCCQITVSTNKPEVVLTFSSCYIDICYIGSIIVIFILKKKILNLIVFKF